MFVLWGYGGKGGVVEGLPESLKLVKSCLPNGATAEIEITDGILIKKVLLRVTYVSARSGRTFTNTIGLDGLPCKSNMHVIRPRILTNDEVPYEFSRLAYYEERVRRNAFMGGDRTVRIVSKEQSRDKISGIKMSKYLGLNSGYFGDRER